MESSSTYHVEISRWSLSNKAVRFCLTGWQEDGVDRRKCYGAVKSTVTKMVMLVNGPDVSPVSLLLDHKNIGINQINGSYEPNTIII